LSEFFFEIIEGVLGFILGVVFGEKLLEEREILVDEVEFLGVEGEFILLFFFYFGV
jgi:hypothetical protein